MNTDRFRLRALFAALAADPYRKLIAVVLAVGMWFFVNGQITGSTVRTVSLQCVGSVRSGEEEFGSRLAVVLPDDRVVGRRFMNGTEEIQSVKVHLSGPRFSIERLENQKEPLNLEITRFGSLDWSTRREIELTAADIRPDIRGLEGLDIELEPSRIRLEVERIESTPLRLSLEDSVLLDVPDDETLSRLRLDTADFQPPEARILGPAPSIAKIRQPGLKPLRARVRRVTGERTVSATLELAVDKELGLTLAEAPTVTFQVQPELSVYQFELPVVVDDLALPPNQRGLYQAEHETMLVRVSVGGQLRTTLKAREPAQQQTWAAENMRLLVVMEPLAGGAVYDRPEYVFAARLVVLETPLLTVDHSERALDGGVSVTLRRRP